MRHRTRRIAALVLGVGMGMGIPAPRLAPAQTAPPPRARPAGELHAQSPAPDVLHAVDLPAPRSALEALRMSELRLRPLAARGERGAALAALRAHHQSPDPHQRTLAAALLYEHAPRLGIDPAARDRLREELRTTAEDPDAPATARDEACRVLLTTDWSGRDAWFDRLLQDPGLRHVVESGLSYAPLRWPLRKDPAHWVPRLVARLGQAPPGPVRTSLAHLLAEQAEEPGQPARPEVARALVPWLADPAWADAPDYAPGPRALFVLSLQRMELREAIPGLLHMLETETGHFAVYAAVVLGRYREPRALPALRRALAAYTGPGWERGALVAAIEQCGGGTQATRR